MYKLNKNWVKTEVDKFLPTYRSIYLGRYIGRSNGMGWSKIVTFDLFMMWSTLGTLVNHRSTYKKYV